MNSLFNKLNFLNIPEKVSETVSDAYYKFTGNGNYHFLFLLRISMVSIFS